MRGKPVRWTGAWTLAVLLLGVAARYASSGPCNVCTRGASARNIGWWDSKALAGFAHAATDADISVGENRSGPSSWQTIVVV